MPTLVRLSMVLTIPSQSLQQVLVNSTAEGCAHLQYKTHVHTLSISIYTYNKAQQIMGPKHN